jgi:uncharacterized protein YndB with AHSA1/START domain
MEASVAAEGAIEREMRIGASPETVFDHWVDPVRLARWMGRDIVLEARPGGAYRIDYNGSDIASGSYVEVDRPHRLVMTWGWEASGDPTPPGASLVEVTFERDGDGTVLRLRHSMLVPEAVAGHAEGWDYFLGRLTEALADA